MIAVTDDFTWLHYPPTGGHFRCPNAALKDWLGMGWERCDPPAEPNPVVVERIAWEREQAELAAATAVEEEAATEADTDPALDTAPTEALPATEPEEG